MLKQLTGLALIVTTIGIGYFGVRAVTANPCSVPKTFSVTTVDPQFGVSKETIALYSKGAASAWNKEYPTNELLTYVEKGGDIRITLVYDERQRTTIQNEQLKVAINEEKDELTSIQQTLASLKEEFTALEQSVEQKTNLYNSRLEKYNKDVAYWNARGGAPTNTYQRLEREQATLETERVQVNATISKYNLLAERIQNYGKDHNDVVATINQKIYTLNETVIREFEEGTYDPNTDTITIYEFGSELALRRVLMHELGHALGLGHVTDEKAIMYEINQGKDLNIKEDDRAALSALCRERTLGDIADTLIAIRDDIFHHVQSSLLGRSVQEE